MDADEKLSLLEKQCKNMRRAMVLADAVAIYMRDGVPLKHAIRCAKSLSFYKDESEYWPLALNMIAEIYPKEIEEYLNH